MPSVSISLEQRQIDDIAVVVRLGASRLNALADALERMKPTIRNSELRRVIEETVGSEAASPVRRVLTGLAFAIRTRGIAPVDLLKAMGTFVRSKASENDVRLWHECSPILERLIIAPAVVLTTKARDLAEDFERALTNVRILTDIRPVYDDTDEVAGAEIVHTLRIEYDCRADNNTGTISFALDLADVTHQSVS